jgi:hypothetical protein
MATDFADAGFTSARKIALEIPLAMFLFVIPPFVVKGQSDERHPDADKQADNKNHHYQNECRNPIKLIARLIHSIRQIVLKSNSIAQGCQPQADHSSGRND